MTEIADPIGLVLYNPPHAKKKLKPEDFYQIKSFFKTVKTIYRIEKALTCSEQPAVINVTSSELELGGKVI